MAEGRLFYWVANWSLARAQAARLLGGEAAVADMADCTTGHVNEVLDAFPAVRRFAAYITGAGIAWTSTQITEARRRGAAVLLIDQSDANAPHDGDLMVVKDDEPGASTTPVAVQVAAERIRSGRDYAIYCSQATLAAVEQAAGRHGLPHGEIVAYQFASPSSDPNLILPGTGRTLREVNADLSVVRRDWLPAGSAPAEPVPGKLPDPRILRAEIALDPVGEKWSIMPRPSVAS